jgi:hypothetical protein
MPKKKSKPIVIDLTDEDNFQWLKRARKKKAMRKKAVKKPSK